MIVKLILNSFNPYFTGLPILIIVDLGDMEKSLESFNPYFTGLPILIYFEYSPDWDFYKRFNPYFTGLPILMVGELKFGLKYVEFQSLFYWITYSYTREVPTRNSHATSVSILILLDYLFLLLFLKKVSLYSSSGFNPYFTGLPILM